MRAALAAETVRAQAAETELAQARALASCSEAMIQELKLEIAKLRRDKYGISSERRARLIDQLELQLEELEAAATEDALAAEQAAARADTTVHAFTRRKPVRKPFPDHLPRERVVVEAPTSCSCCGSDRIVKMGEDITETLEVIPRQWKVIQTVREKFTCRTCEKISQPPAPFHTIPRGWAGPHLIAMVAFEKYGQHRPLNRQSERFVREGVDIIPTALAFDRFGVITGCDGFDDLDVVGEEVPCVAALRDDLLVGLEDGDGEAVGAQIGPDILDWIEFRGIGRKQHEGDIDGRLQGLCCMPACPVEHESGVRALGDRP